MGIFRFIPFRATDKGRFIVFTNYFYKQIEIKKTSYKNELLKEKANYDQPFDHFDNPSLMALVFLDQFLLVYKPVNPRGARSFNIFSLFCCQHFRNETGNENNR